MNEINTCPECGNTVTTRQLIDVGRYHVELTYSCKDCKIDFVTTLTNPMKEVTFRYEE